MARLWTPVPIPLFVGGEDSSSAPLATQRANVVENGLLTGTGSVQQIADWRVSGTCVNGAAVEAVAVCGLFPFATQGSASAPSAGMAFSFDTSGNIINYHQLGEEGNILRVGDAYTAYAESAPPQMTGFESFGRFYVCPDGREAAASRKGMGYYDPAANTFTIPTFDVGGGAAALRFRGIVRHRGATILGWGYLSNSTPDSPSTVRYCKYGDSDTWVPDATPITAGFFNVGTPELPVVAAAASGQYTVLGKVGEVFILDGDYSEQFYLSQIGTAHGPVSGTGMCSTGPMAVWMGQSGPAYSINGGPVTRLATERVFRRMLTYFDLTYTTAVHDATRSRVGFLLRRQADLSGTPVTDFWPTQILWWDYVRDAITVQGTPTTCFTIGTINGPGVSLAGPSGTPSSLVATVSGSSGCQLTWSDSGGDPSAAVSVEYKPSSAGTYTVVGPAAAGSGAWTLTGLSLSTTYDWRLRYFKNSQYGSYVAGTSFTTTAASKVGTPTGFTGALTGPNVIKGVSYFTETFTWNQREYSTGALTRIYEGTTATFADATLIATMGAATTAYGVTKAADAITAYYYWLQYVLADGTAGTAVANATNPVTYAF